MEPALFDDYPNDDIGHHPALAFGMASAAHARSQRRISLFCPRTFLGGLPAPPYVDLHACEGPTPYRTMSSRANVRRVVDHVQSGGADFVFNLFLDENFDSFRGLPVDARIVHALHRPGPQPRGPMSRRAKLDWLNERPHDVVVVHTSSGLRLAREAAPAARIVRAGWPAAHRDDVIVRFERENHLPASAPHVLVVGGARVDKGIECLLEAAQHGPEIRVLGEQAPGLHEQLSRRFPQTRIRWHTSWVSPTTLDEAIARASACVFPYLAEFGRHAGASGALAQALTHPVPVIVSSTLADQVPVSAACQVVPTGDVGALKNALDQVSAADQDLREAASGRLAFALEEHTYEGHFDRVITALEASA